MKRHIMLDLETLDTRPSAAIVSIGAVEFDTDGPIAGREFYRVLQQPQQLILGRTESAETLRWWSQQSEEARAVFTAPAVDPFVALQDFAAFWSGADYLWSNGANFDGVLLTSLYQSFEVPVPWEFWQERCYRTLVDLYHQLACTTPTKTPAAHNALADAVAQAQKAGAILQYLDRARWA